jgi:hypothetical protein
MGFLRELVNRDRFVVLVGSKGAKVPGANKPSGKQLDFIAQVYRIIGKMTRRK